LVLRRQSPHESLAPSFYPLDFGFFRVSAFGLRISRDFTFRVLAFVLRMENSSSRQSARLTLDLNLVYLPSFWQETIMYAVLETGSKQYRVSAGDRLEIERLAVEAGQPVTFERVLMVNQDGKITIGSPTVADTAVLADVVEHIRGEKKIAVKMKRRKG